MSERQPISENLLDSEELLNETSDGEEVNEEASETIYNSEKPIFDNNTAELLSALAVIASIALNTESLGPNIELAVGTFHVLIFFLLKEAWKRKENGEYSRKDLAQALARISAPFLTGGIIANGEQVLQTLNNVDQTIGFTEAVSDIAPKIFMAVIGGAIGTATVGGVGYLGIKAVNGLVNSYRNIKNRLISGAQGAIAGVKSYEPQMPISEPRLPLKKVEFQNPVKKAEWQSPFNLKWPWRKKRSENG